MYKFSLGNDIIILHFKLSSEVFLMFYLTRKQERSVINDSFRAFSRELDIIFKGFIEIAELKKITKIRYLVDEVNGKLIKSECKVVQHQKRNYSEKLERQKFAKHKGK